MLSRALAVVVTIAAGRAHADHGVAPCTRASDGTWEVPAADVERCEQAERERHLAPYYRWRWEAAVGGSFGTLRLRQQDLGPAGLFLQAGIRDHRLAFAADYRRLGVSWHAAADATRSDPAWVSMDTGGALDRLGAVARFNVLTLGLDLADKNMHFAHEFAELFVEAGGGVERIAWDHGGELWRGDAEFGGGIRLYGMRVTEHRTIGLLFRITKYVSRRPSDYTMTPVCSGPCDRPTPPTSWDTGLLLAIAFVVSS